MSAPLPPTAHVPVERASGRPVRRISVRTGRSRTRKTKISRLTTIWESRTAKWDCWKKPSANSRRSPVPRTRGRRFVMPCNAARCWAWRSWRRDSRPSPRSGTNARSRRRDSIRNPFSRCGMIWELRRSWPAKRAAAFQSFSQVYAMNIDYRDVSERIALLGKAR